MLPNKLPQARVRAVIPLARELKFFDDDVLIGVDADLAGNAQRFNCNFASGKIRVFDQGARGRQRIRAAGTDRQYTFVRCDHVAVA